MPIDVVVTDHRAENHLHVVTAVATRGTAGARIDTGIENGTIAAAIGETVVTTIVVWETDRAVSPDVLVVPPERDWRENETTVTKDRDRCREVVEIGIGNSSSSNR